MARYFPELTGNHLWIIQSTKANLIKVGDAKARVLASSEKPRMTPRRTQDRRAAVLTDAATSLRVHFQREETTMMGPPKRGTSHVQLQLLSSFLQIFLGGVG